MNVEDETNLGVTLDELSGNVAASDNIQLKDDSELFEESI